MKLSPDAHTVIDVAQVLGGHAYIVGGAVRDHLLGLAPKDLDIEVHGIADIEQFAATLRGYGKVDEVGVAFGVLKFKDLDVSFPRRDSKIGDGHKQFKITVDPTLPLRDALERRDFTINSMAWDPHTHELIDPFGGLQDLDAKILRHTSEAFAEDPLRVMRAVQFATRFGFTIAPDTAKLCRSLLPLQRTLAKERVWGEWEKILEKGRHFDAFYRAIRDTGIDQIIDTTFLGHTGKEESRVIGKPRLILALWATRMVGARRQEFLHSFGMPHDMARDALKLAGGYMMMVSHRSPDATWVRAIARHVAPFTLRELMSALPREEEEHFHRVHHVAAEADCLYGAQPPLISGHDLMELGLTPGPHFGPILKKALDAQDRGEYTTREEGIALVQQGRFDS